MLEPEAAPGLEPDHRPIDIHGPQSEARELVRRASPARLALRLLLAALLLGGGAAAAYRARDWYAERLAREARVAHIPGGKVRIGNPHGPPEERPEHEITLAAYDIDITEVTVAAYATCVKRG